MNGEETRRYIGKLIMLAFAVMLFWIYSQRNIPTGSFAKMGLFLFTFFLNFCTQWALYKLQLLSGKWMQLALLAIQCLFFYWTWETSRFVFETHTSLDYQNFLYTPLEQLGFIFPLFIIMLIVHTIRNR